MSKLVKVSKNRNKIFEIAGIDPSMNGTAITIIFIDPNIPRKHSLRMIKYFTKKKGDVKNFSEGIVHPVLMQIQGIDRLRLIGEEIKEVYDKFDIDYTGIENYAIGMTKGYKPYHIGEVGGLLRYIARDSKIIEPFPQHVKMLLTNNGGATKAQVMDALKEITEFDTFKYGVAGEDIADSYTIALLTACKIWVEHGWEPDGSIYRTMYNESGKRKVRLINEPWK